MVFEFTDGRTRLYQWDSDVILAFPELADGTEVHFAASSSMSIKRTVADGVAMIPNVLLQRNRNILMFVFRDDTTVDEGEIEVVGRPKPPDYVYTDQEVLTWQMHDWRIEDLESKLPVYVSLSMSGGKYTADKTVAELEEAYQNGCDLYCMCPYNGKTYKLPLRIRGDEFTWTFAGVTDGLSLTVTDFANIVAVEAARCVYNVNGVAPDAYGRVEVLNSKAFYVAVTNASGKYTADKTVTAIEAAYQRNDSIYCLCDFGGEIYTLPLWNRAAPTVWMFSNAGDGNEVNVIITGDVVTVFSRQAVKTVNGQKPNSAGAVTVAIPEKVSDLQNDSGFITGAAVSEHNTATTSHNDIRQLINGLTNRLNALANSDDTTLDQMAEVVSYIKSNRTLIESITTGKVNVSDIVDNLTTNVSNKPLSAAQGVALKKLIDAITIPTTLPNPNALTFTGAASGSYDGSGAKTVNIPTVPSALPNPKALTINGQSYDGSEEVKITIEGGSGTGGSSEIYDTRKDIPEPVTITVGTDPEMTLTLVDGKEYTVSYDGKDYTCTAHAYDWGIALGFDAYDSVGNHEPFYLIQWVDAGETGWILEHWNKTSGETVVWSICEGALKKLDYKYLDYGKKDKAIGTVEGINFTESTDENGITYSGSSTSKEAMGLDYADLVVGETYYVYIGDAKYVMACGVSEDAADGDTVRVLKEVYPGLNKYASVVVYQPTSTNDVQIQCYAAGGTYPVRICKEVIETIPEEFLPEGIGGGLSLEDLAEYGVPYVVESQGEILPETVCAYHAGEGAFIVEPFVSVSDGEKYTITLNGVTYESNAKFASMDGMSGFGLGNVGAISEAFETTDHPFALVLFDAETYAVTGLGGMIMFLDGGTYADGDTATLKIEGNGTKIQKLDNRCLDLPWHSGMKSEVEFIPETTAGFRTASIDDVECTALIWQNVEYELSKDTTYYLYVDGVGTELKYSRSESGADYYVPAGGTFPAMVYALFEGVPMLQIAIADTVEGDHTFSVKTTAPVPLPVKYLPSSVPYVLENQTETIFAEQAIQLKNNMYMENAVWPLVLGETYTVTWDGVAYDCVCITATFQGMATIGIGNAAIYGGGENTGEPFAVGVVGTQSGFIGTDNNSHTVSIVWKGSKVQKLDNRCLDLEWYAASEEVELMPETALEFSENIVSADGQTSSSCSIFNGIEWASAFTAEDSIDCMYLDGKRIPLKFVSAGGDPADGTTYNYTDTGSTETLNYGINLMPSMPMLTVVIVGSAAGTHTVKLTKVEPNKMPEAYFPEEIGSFIMRSSTEGSTKKFRVTIDDTGAFAATEIT